jgi:hypothetical protein
MTRAIDRLRTIIQDDRDRLDAALAHERAVLTAKTFDLALALAAVEAERDELAAALHHTDVARLRAEEAANVYRPLSPLEIREREGGQP